MNKKEFIISLIVLFIDQLSKILVQMFLINNTITIIPSFFQLNYSLNTGAAWSILNNHTIILIIISLILLFILFIFKKNFKQNKRNELAFGFLIGGIMGNLLDRVFKGYVIDFLDFNIFGYDYPIFNFADIFIVVGIFLLIFAILRGEDK